MAFSKKIDLARELAAQSPDVRARLQERSRARAERRALPELVRVDGREGSFPASYQQQALWLAEQLNPGTAVYNVPIVLELRGPLDARAWEQAVAWILRRHESLRTTLRRSGEDEVVERVSEEVPVLRVVDAPSPGAVRAAIRDEIAVPFSVDGEPLVRATLLRRTPAEHVFVLTVHHALIDAWSSEIVVRDLLAAYKSFTSGDGVLPVSAGDVRYVDYAAWQRAAHASGAFDHQLAYWKAKLHGAPAALELAGDRARPPRKSPRGGEITFEVPSDVLDALRTLARAEAATSFMIFAAALDVLLARHTNEDDVVLGMPMSNRRHPSLAGLVGFFVNTLPLRVSLDGRPSFREVVRRVRAAALEVYDNQDVPFGRVVEAVKPPRDPSRTAIYQAAIAHRTLSSTEDVEVAGVRVHTLSPAHETSKFDLELGIDESPEGVRGVLVYDAEIFDRSTAERLVERYQTLLRAAVARPDERAHRLPMLSRRDEEIALSATRVASVPVTECLHSLFEAQVARAPDEVAAVFEATRWTYRELDERANQLAHLLRSRGVGAEDRVAFCFERGLEPVVAILAILKAGAAYVPIDPLYPPERRAFIVEDSKAVFVLTTAALAAGFGDQVLALDAEATRDAVAKQSRIAPSPVATPSRVAYVIYTSGSTGRPKGSAIPHANVVRLLRSTEEWYGFGPDDCWTVFHSFAFDFSVWEIWGALAYGGRLAVVSQAVTRSPRDFLALLKEEGVTVLNQTPSAFLHLAGEALAQPDGLSLRWVIFGGEALDVAALRPWFDLFGDERPKLVNMYGITETTVHVTYRPLSLDDTYGKGSVIGRPIPDMSLVIVDDELNPVPIGVRGELCVGGAGASRCYLGRPDLTATRFVPDPFSVTPGARLYRSGDVARWLPDGDVEYLGRLDFQVKIRGYRIELGEIEAALAAMRGVDRVLVLAREDVPGDKRLVAYVVPERGASIDVDALRSDLRRAVPDYMVPSAFVVLDALPLTGNGKIDRRALPAPDFAAPAAAYVAPRSGAEQAVAEIFADVLRVERVGTNDNFFELGGHSLLAARVVGRVRATLGVELPMRELFDSPTVAGIARWVEVARGDGATASAHAIVPVARDGVLPLSFGEARLWFLDRLNPGGVTYSVPTALRLRGALDVAALRRALGDLVARHETLRTRYVERDGEPVRVVEPPPSDVLLETIDLGHLRDAALETAVQRWLEDDARRPFDLAAGPPFRASLLVCGHDHHVLVLDAHHIVTDAWSFTVLVRDLLALYVAARDGRPAALPPLSVQYADFAAWQRRTLAGAVLEERLAFWKPLLTGVPPLELPTDRPRVWTGREPPADVVPVAMGVDVLERVRAFAHAEGATPFMVGLAAFAALMGRSANQTTFAVGVPVAGRSHHEIEDVVGFFVNSLALPFHLDSSITLRELVRRTRDDVLAAFAHQDLPFERLVDELDVARDVNRAPVFQVMFAVHADMGNVVRADGLEAHTIDRTSLTTAKFDVSMDLVETSEGFRGDVEYRSDLFDRVTIERLLARFARVLDACVRDPDSPLGALSLVLDDDLRQLAVWNATDVERPSICIHELFAARAQERPDDVALELGQERVTYGDLRRRSVAMARALARRGVGRGEFVGICLDRSVDLVVTLLAVLEAGAAYLPLDAGYPVDRLAFMIDDVRPAMIVTTAKHRSLLRVGDDRVLLVEALDRELARAVAGGDAAAPRAVHPDEPAYVIFTSGSTGKPKGAVNAHRGVVNRLFFARDAYGLERGDKVLHKAPLSFDVSVSEIFLPLVVGATLVIAEPEAHRDPARIARTIAEHRVTAVEFVPSLLAAFLDEPDLAGCECMKAVTSSGEALPVDVLQRFHERFPRATLFNFYGPSETSVDVIAWRAEHNALQVPIGRPLANTRAYVLDDEQRLVPVGGVGELYIGGMNVGLGYKNRAALTAERFVPDPFSEVAGARMYRTGDVCRWRVDGTIEFRGRVDHQVKLRGQRIELGEIEATLREMAGIRDAVVIVREDEPGDQRLVAYLVGEGSGALPAADDVRVALKQKLAPYMIPNAFVALAEIPLNPSGKVDRKRLPAVDEGAAGQTGGTAYEAPRDDRERAMAAIWSEVLQRPRIGVHDDFFELGGHSLLAARIAARVRRDMKLALPLIAIFETPTIAAVCSKLRDASAAATFPPIVAGPRVQRFLPSYSQLAYFEYERAVPGTKSWCNVDALLLRGPLDGPALAAAHRALLERQDVLRGTFSVQGGEPWFELLPLDAFVLAEHDLSSHDEEHRRRTLREIALHLQRPYEPVGGTMFRSALVRLAEDEHALLIGYHHMVADQLGSEVIRRDLLAFYRAYADGVAAPPELALRYADYARWQRALTREIVADELKFWREHLATAPVVAIPADLQRTTPDGSRAQHVRDAKFAKAMLDDLVRSVGASSLAGTLAAVELALMSMTGQEDFALPIVVASGRQLSSELENVVGNFSNWMRVRTNLVGAGSFREVLQRTKASAFAALPRHFVPVQWTHDVASPQTSAAFPMCLNVAPEVPETAESSRGGLWATELTLEGVRPDRKWDASFLTVPVGEEVVVLFMGATDLFSPHAVGEVARRIARAVQVGHERPDAPLRELLGALAETGTA